MHVRLDLIKRQALFQAIARPLKVALEPRFELRFRFTLLALEPLDEPVNRRAIAHRQLSLSRREPAKKHFGIAARVRLARHSPQPANAGVGYAPLEFRGKGAQPAPESSQVDAKVVQGLAAFFGGQTIALTAEILDQRERDQSRRAGRGVVEDRRVERHPAFSRRVHAVAMV